MSLDIYLKETRPCIVYDDNITHNLGKMAKAAGIYQALWHPEEIGLSKASELSALLAPAIKDMIARPEYYKRFNAPNGWGMYDNFLPWLERLLAACLEHPDADIEVSV